MKKYMIAIGILFMLVILSACSSTSSLIANNPNTANVHVQHNSSSPFYEMQLSFYQDGHLKSSQGTLYADGSPIKHGDVIIFTFLEEDFDMDRPVSVVVSASRQQNAGVVEIGTIGPLTITKGNTYKFEVADGNNGLIFR